MSVSLTEVMAAASQRLAPLSGECAGHAVLAAVDQLLTNPRLLGAADVHIEENGAVRLAHGQATDARGCDEALRSLLDGLLTVAHSGGAGLLRVGRRAATGDLAQLVRELEVALIPANRAAARRSLARLCRETCRARESGSLSALPAPSHERRAPAPLVPEPARPDAAMPEPARPDTARLEPAMPEPAVVELAALAPAPAETVGSAEASREATGELLAVTEMRWATAPRRVPPPVRPAPTRPDFAHLQVGAALEVDDVLEVDAALEVDDVLEVGAALEGDDVLEVGAALEVGDVLEVGAALEGGDVLEVDAKLEVDAALEVDIDLAAITPVVGGHTQPLPKVAPRRALHETLPLPPVSRRPMPAEHETPLEPVLSRRHAGLPRPQPEFADIHQTPYLGTQVSTVPVYDARAREAWQVPTPAPASATAEWDTDEATTDPAPVVAWSAPDEDGELLEIAPLPACPALAMEPRVPPLAAESGIPPLVGKEPRVFRPSEVEELVERFSIAEPGPDPQLSRSLKQLAGITATPPPVLARAEAAPGPLPRKPPAPSEPGSPVPAKPSARVAGS